MSESIYKIFDKTLRYYKISGKQLAQASEVSQGHISGFRNGRVNLSTEVLERVLVEMDAIAPGSRLHFCELLAGQNLAPTVAVMLQQVECMDATDLAQLLNIVADRLTKKKVRAFAGTLT